MAMETVYEKWGQVSYYGTDADRHELPYVTRPGAKFYNQTHGTVYSYLDYKWYLAENPLEASDKPATYTKLAIPTVTVSAGGVVSWSSVANATNYTTIVYTAAGVAGTPTTSTSGGVTLTAGQSVVVRANGATVYLNSSYSTPIMYIVPTISYVTRLGTAPDSITNNTGTIPSGALTLLADSGGFEQEGWYLEPNCITKATAATTHLNGQHITLYANWQPITYTVTYELDGGTNAGTNPVIYNTTKAYTLAPATKDGGTFLGWYDAASDGELITRIPPGWTENKTLYAYWALAEYTISYVLNGSINHEDNPDTYNVDTETITLESASRLGYTFNGWYDNEEFTGSAVTEIVKGSFGNVVLYAKLTIKEYTLAYDFGELTEVTNPYSEIVEFTVEDLPIALNQSASKQDYDFDGWFTEDTYENAITSLTLENYLALVETDTVTLYGKLTYNVAVALGELDDDTTTNLVDVAEVLTLTTTFPATINAVLTGHKLDYKLDFSQILASVTEGSVSISAITYGGVDLDVSALGADLLTNPTGYLSEYTEADVGGFDAEFARESVVDSADATPALVVTILNESGITLTGDVVFEVVVSDDDFTTETQIAVDTEQVSIIDVI